MSAPLVLIVCNRRVDNGREMHMIWHQYVRPLEEIVKATPVLAPAQGGTADLSALWPVISGVLLTGAVSNVAPARYGASQGFSDTLLDTPRDGTAFDVIRTAVARDIPLLAICRGMQEMNVALGGTLHQAVHDVPGMQDHRGDARLSRKDMYEARAHGMRVLPGGLLSRIGLPEDFFVNTLHGQGIDRLGDGLRAEAAAPDGLIEAVSVPGKKFALGVQWHPEGDFHLNPASRQLFAAFGAALGGS